MDIETSQMYKLFLHNSYRSLLKSNKLVKLRRDEHDPVGAVHRCLHAAIHTLEADAKEKGLPVRFAATKLVEKDYLIAEKLCLPQEKETAFKHLVFPIIS